MEVKEVELYDLQQKFLWKTMFYRKFFKCLLLHHMLVFKSGNTSASCAGQRVIIHVEPGFLLCRMPTFLEFPQIQLVDIYSSSQ